MYNRGKAAFFGANCSPLAQLQKNFHEVRKKRGERKKEKKKEKRGKKRKKRRKTYWAHEMRLIPHLFI
jgi:hypothetical protein